MDLYLTGKKVVITASSDGIGYAVAELFLKEQAYVLVNGRNREKVEVKCEKLRSEFGEDHILAYVGDASEKTCISEMKELIEKAWGSVDCIIPNLGCGKPLSTNRLDQVEWEVLYDMNLYSAVKLVESFHSLLNPKGSVVFVSSLAATERIGAPYAYAAAKSGIKVLTKYLSDDYALRDIRVNCVMPGNVFYEGGRWEELMNMDSEGVRQYIEQNVPMKRFGKPCEIADAIVFLASERASFITGTTLVVDGGQKRGLCS